MCVFVCVCVNVRVCVCDIERERDSNGVIGGGVLCLQRERPTILLVFYSIKNTLYFEYQHNAVMCSLFQETIFGQV